MKELEEIYQEMLDCFAQRTGLEAAESCDLAVRFYAVAAQVYALYAQADWVLRQCFPQTAAGSCLDSHAQLRGLSRKQATAAEGSIRFSVAQAADTAFIIHDPQKFDDDIYWSNPFFGYCILGFERLLKMWFMQTGIPGGGA